MNFIGRFSAKIDAKNRVFLPSSFRKTVIAAAEESLVIRKDYFENCLVIYPMSEWKAEVERVRQRLNRFDVRQQMVYRQLLSEAQEVQIDSSGRILISKQQLEKVGIQQDVVFVGMQQVIELWDAKAVETDSTQGFISEQEFAKELMNFMKSE
ncbi:MAG: division/cell wall cluster transcriptional repressor MraZ [Bacteroidaceae bacterium]|nr:division/cell wall cluster transcriptional repressor MraZ [Bacteroidaceae bacterium]MBO5932096.1 division/cell wall cluster transcriptional repressor MraZ [Bacteroidaceae bacterium]MBO5951142.1 division/cell wall cluster transcriptional repressor MraZ [Bacteroidaceae bacterium]MBO7248251.1 division/cell wall cluster transcriptional repressor MraZ [Bacteroidaceae bacterium]